MISLDGYFEGPNRDLSWHTVDEEFNNYAADLLDSLDALLFGRVTYQLMADYWPSPAALTDDPMIAAKMNSLPKVVFSTSLQKVDWSNTRLVKEDAAAEVTKLKRQSGKDMAVFGSSDLASMLSEHGLIDEYRIIVNPVVLGHGKSLFAGLEHPLKLTFSSALPFTSGLVMLTYQRAGSV